MPGKAGQVFSKGKWRPAAGGGGAPKTLEETLREYASANEGQVRAAQAEWTAANSEVTRLSAAANTAAMVANRERSVRRSPADLPEITPARRAADRAMSAYRNAVAARNAARVRYDAEVAKFRSGAEPIRRAYAGKSSPGAGQV